MENEYVKSVDELLKYNDFREDDNDKHLNKLLDGLKKHISGCGSYTSAVGFCKQFLHDIEWYEQQNMCCGEIRRNLMELKIKFEDMEERK